jgi:hypothetical protein
MSEPDSPDSGESASESASVPRSAQRAALGRKVDRKVRQVFRVSAVRRSGRPGDGERGSPDALRVSDEELVHAIWDKRDQFLTRLSKLANEQLPPNCQVKSIDLQDVRPAASVLVDLLFVVRVGGNAVAAVAGLSGAVVVAVAETLEASLEIDAAVSAAPERAGPPAAGPSSGWDRLAPVLAFIGTGIGVLGFVTFIGGLIVWARLRANGFPAAPALGVFPSQDLLVIGAQTLVPQVLVALAAVAGLVLLYAVARVLRERVSEEEAALLAGQATLLAATGMFAFVLIALVVAVAPFFDELSRWQDVMAVGGAVLAALLAAAVGTMTRRILYLATTAFVLVGIFMGFVAYWRARNDTTVRGAAVIRDNKTAIAGIFVAEGSNRVYLARIGFHTDGTLNDDLSRLVGVAKDQITDVAIAGAQPAPQALVEAEHLAKELCELQPRVVSAAGAPPPENCRTAPPGEHQP